MMIMIIKNIYENIKNNYNNTNKQKKSKRLIEFFL